jgi:hypothetical protein
MHQEWIYSLSLYSLPSEFFLLMAWSDFGNVMGLSFSSAAIVTHSDRFSVLCRTIDPVHKYSVLLEETAQSNRMSVSISEPYIYRY